MKLIHLLLEEEKAIQFKKPDFAFEWEEAKRYPEFEAMGKEDWIKIAQKGFITKYSEIKDVLKNVDLDFKGLEEPKKDRFKSAIETGEIELPIAVKFSDQDYDLVAGNTRLSGLVALEMDPSLWIVNL